MARAMGDKISPIGYVITSDTPRAIETAVAMGFAVNETWTELGDIVILQQPQIMQKLRIRIFERLANIPEDTILLIISHAGIVEEISNMLFPELKEKMDTFTISYCEGFRISFEDETPQGVEILRFVG
jgi:phosphohistidine phosphatase SixA